MIYKRLFQYVKPYMHILILSMVCMIFVSGLTSLVALLVKPVLDKIFINKQEGMLYILPEVILGAYILKSFFDFAQAYLTSYVGQKVVMDIRKKIYENLVEFPLSYFKKVPTGVLISRITNDVTLLQGAVTNALTSIIKDLFTIAGLVGVIFYRDFKLAIISFCVFPIASVPIVKFGKRIKRISRRNQEIMAVLTNFLNETIQGIKMVKAFCMEDYEKKRFSETVRKLFKSYMRSQLIRSLSSPVIESLGGIGIAVVVFYGGYSVIKGETTPGNFFSFMTATMMLYRPIRKLSKSNNIINQGLAAAERVFKVLDEAKDIKEKKSGRVVSKIRGDIEFKNVYFKYEDSEDFVLKDINLKVEKGKVLALVGESGAGKTTLVDLILRFYDVSYGKITIDGIDIRDLDLTILRKNISIVSQNVFLFNDTIRNNIAYGDVTKSFEEIVSAAKAANAHEFITQMPDGYDTVVGEHGTRLSGGEKQRISIARAILKDAPILILDEATSSLDTKSENEIQEALKNLTLGKTTIVIAHRLSTVMNADKIVVLKDGEIVEEGDHKTLIERGGEYKTLYETQFAKGELRWNFQ